MVHGLFMEAMRWDTKSMHITDPDEMNPVRLADIYSTSLYKPTILAIYSHYPVMHMEPRRNLGIENDYKSPLYKTGARARSVILNMIVCCLFLYYLHLIRSDNKQGVGYNLHIIAYN